MTIDIGEDKPQPSPRDMIPRNSSMSAMINLHPLIEDDGPGSPNSPKDKVMFGNTKDTDTESKLIDLSSNKKQEDGEQVTTPRSLSEFPTDVVEQANLERSRLIRRESLRKVKDLPLPEQGVTQETVATAESPRDPGSPPPALKVGDVVRVSETMEGQVRFYGRTQFADGVWVGIALSIPDGELDFV